MNHKVERAIVLAGVFACAGCITCAARLADAELQFRRGTLAAIEQAADWDRFAPPDAYFERLAELDPEHSAQWLAAALKANPRSTSAWIAQGLASERVGQRAGQFEEAEHDLLEAARVDRQYLPAWTLANFYFRRQASGQSSGQSSDQFWIWARRAAALTYDDFRPLLALAHAVEPDPRVVFEKLGGGDPLLRADLDYLTAHGRFDDAQEVARLLLSRRTPASNAASNAEAPRLLELADRQILAGNAGYALELWNAVAAPLHQERLDPDRGPVLANGDLLRSPSAVAFDWKLPRSEGAIVTWAPSRLSLSFSGDQPDSCALLEQIVPVARGRRYRLQFEYFTAGLTSPTGVAWELDEDQGPALKPAGAWLAAAALLSPSADLHIANAKPGRASLGRLRLLYRREPGTVRAQGRLELRHLRMEVL